MTMFTDVDQIVVAVLDTKSSGIGPGSFKKSKGDVPRKFSLSINKNKAFLAMPSSEAPVSGTLSLLDINGRTLALYPLSEIGPGYHILTLPGHAKGIYFARLNTPKVRTTVHCTYSVR